MNTNMPFHVGIAYGIAFVAVSALVCLARGNRRTGWQKPVTNEFLDLLMAWAQAKEENRQTWNKTTAMAPQEVSDIGTQLGALGAALTVNSGPAPTMPARNEKFAETASASQPKDQVLR